MSERAAILSLLADSDPERIREGAQRACQCGMKEAVPDLIRHISSPNIGVQDAVDRALRTIGGSTVLYGVIPLLRSDDAPVRNIAMDILRTLGHTDLPAVQALLKDEDEDVRIFAADILGSTGSALAVPSLCHALLNDPEPNVRYQAAVSLGMLAFPESAPSLNQALKDEEWVQFAVVEALTKIRDSSSVGALAKALGKSSELVASSIADALGEMGDIKAVPLLLRRLDSSPPPLSNKIIRAVINIMGEGSLSLLGPKENNKLRGYLPSALEDEDQDIQNAAVRGFAALGVDGATTCILRHVSRLDCEQDAERIQLAVKAMVRLAHTGELEAAIREGDEMTAQIAMEVLLRIDEATAVPLLVSLFWDRSRDMQRQMILELANRAGSEHEAFFLDVLNRHKDGKVLRSALLFLGHKGNPETTPRKVMPFLEHEYDDVKRAALEACITLHTPEVEQFFKSLASSEDLSKRMIGVYGLGFFNIDSSSAILTASLNDESADVRRLAVESFCRAFPAQEEYLELIESRLSDESREVRMAAYDILGACSDTRFFKNLLTGLDDPDPWVQVRCAEMLAKHKDTDAVPKLVAMLDAENILVVIKAAQALGVIGGESAFRALLPLLDHPERDIREAAGEAVNAIHGQTGE